MSKIRLSLATGAAMLVSLSLFLSWSPVAAQTDPRFSSLDQMMASGELGPLRSLLIQHEGELIHENYYHGGHTEQLQQLFSVTKSVGATLIGMAERRSLLNPQQTVSELMPQYNWSSATLSQHAELRLHDVLTMRHGIEWDEWTHRFPDPRNDYVQMIAQADWYLFLLNRPRISEPDSRFVYSTGASHLMSGMLRQVTGLPPEQIFLQWLAQPLDMASHDWSITGLACPHPQGCPFPFNDVSMGVGLSLRPRDLLKLGELYLRGGVYNGQRLLDEDWIRRSWQPYSNGDNESFFSNAPERTAYGYQWWFREFVDSRDRRIACWYAAGSGRQYMFACPILDLIVVSTSLIADYDGPGIGLAMRQHILPEFDPPIRSHLAGSYYDPEISGQGITVEIWDESDVIWFKWFTYRNGQPLWYVGMGNIEGTEIVVDELLAGDGGEFLAPPPPQIEVVGQVRMRWIDCHQAHLDFNIEGQQGEYHLQRLTGECAP